MCAKYLKNMDEVSTDIWEDNLNTSSRRCSDHSGPIACLGYVQMPVRWCVRYRCYKQNCLRNKYNGHHIELVECLTWPKFVSFLFQRVKLCCRTLIWMLQGKREKIVSFFLSTESKSADRAVKYIFIKTASWWWCSRYWTATNYLWSLGGFRQR